MFKFTEFLVIQLEQVMVSSCKGGLKKLLKDLLWKAYA